jgi:hypothetical protein
MKVALENENDVKCVNWLAVAEQIADYARKKIAETMTRAGNEIKELAPGESRKFVIEIGTVGISRGKDAGESRVIEFPETRE